MLACRARPAVRQDRAVLVVTRHAVDPAARPEFLTRAAAAIAALASQPGCLRATVGLAVDDPGLVVVLSEWASVGAYRRALSSYEVKLHAVPLLLTARDEPSAFEPVLADGPDGPARWDPDRAADADEAFPSRAGGS